MTHFREGPAPDPHPHTRHLQRVPKGKALVFTCLSREILGIWTHWTGQRTQPCLDCGQPCPWCQKEAPRRWKGYIYAQDCNSGQTAVVEVTPGAARQLGNQLHGMKDLRGLQVRLERTPGGGNGRLNAIVVGAYPHLELLPIEIDLRPTLNRLWDHEPTGQAPTLPYNRERRA
jgi:hypothetical protein